MEKRFKCAICVDLLLFKEVEQSIKILLMRRKNTGDNDGEFELPGGHLEKDEDLFTAIIREANEEILIDLKREDLKIAHIMHHYTGERINFIFTANGIDLNPKIGEPDKCDKLEWFDVNALPNNISEKMKHIIENIKKNIVYDKM